MASKQPFSLHTKIICGLKCLQGVALLIPYYDYVTHTVSALTLWNNCVLWALSYFHYGLDPIMIALLVRMWTCSSHSRSFRDQRTQLPTCGSIKTATVRFLICFERRKQKKRSSAKAPDTHKHDLVFSSLLQSFIHRQPWEKELVIPGCLQGHTLQNRLNYLKKKKTKKKHL